MAGGEQGSVDRTGKVDGFDERRHFVVLVILHDAIHNILDDVAVLEHWLVDCWIEHGELTERSVAADDDVARPLRTTEAVGIVRDPVSYPHHLVEQTVLEILRRRPKLEPVPDGSLVPEPGLDLGVHRVEIVGNWHVADAVEAERLSVADSADVGRRLEKPQHLDDSILRPLLTRAEGELELDAGQVLPGRSLDLAHAALGEPVVLVFAVAHEVEDDRVLAQPVHVDLLGLGMKAAEC